MNIFRLLFCLILIAAPTARAGDASIWDPTVFLEMACGTEQPVYLFVCPAGDGSPFSEAQRIDGTVVDATIDLWLYDPFDEPVANYPREDLWLESADWGMVPCTGGTTADHSTDQLGHTVWATPLNAGGSSQTECLVMVSGWAGYTDPLPLHFNSADLTGDRVVNLSDVSIFAGHYFGEFDFAADLWLDGVLNLADVSRLALGLGGSCP